MTHDPHVLCPQEAAKGGRKSQSSLHPPGVAGRGSRRLSVHDKRGPADFHEPEFRSEEDEPGGWCGRSIQHHSMAVWIHISLCYLISFLRSGLEAPMRIDDKHKFTYSMPPIDECKIPSFINWGPSRGGV